MQEQHLAISIQAVHDPSSIRDGDAYGITIGLDHGTVPDGAALTIQIALNYGGEPLSDKLFAETVMHELIHAFGHPDWSARLDDQSQHWDDQLYREMFSDTLSRNDSDIKTQIGSVHSFDAVGDIITGDMTHGLLVGSIDNDSFSSGTLGNIIYSGDGNDNISITLGGGVDEVQDDGGSDTLQLPAATILSAVSAKWSPDGEDLAVEVNGHVEAVLVNANGDGAVEWLQIGSQTYSMSQFVRGTNSTPVGQDTVTDVVGTFQGLIDYATATDPDGDELHFHLESIDGAYADQSWTVQDDGGIIANFMRHDKSGSEFTFLTLGVSDGVSASSVNITVHWASSDDTGPVFGRIGGGESGHDQALSPHLSLTAEALHLQYIIA